MVARAQQSQPRPQPATATADAVLDPEVLNPSPGLGALEQMTRGEIDIQIATAKRYPRSIKEFKDKALAMATLDRETASSCFYVLPKRKGQGESDKAIEGPSVRLAEIVSAAWGHMRVAGRIVEEGDRFVVAQGVAWDVENNVLRSSEVRRRITTREGRRYSDDMVQVTCNAAIAIATRNAVFQVIPQAYFRSVYLECRKVAAGSASTLSADRAKALEHFKSLGVSPARVFAAINVRGLDDITLDHMVTLRGLATAIQDGETSVAEAFPEVGAGVDANGGDPVAQVIAETGADEDTARQILARFDELQLKAAERTVRLKAHKGRAADLLASLAPGTGQASDGAAAADQGEAPSTTAATPATSGSTTPAPAASGRNWRI